MSILEIRKVTKEKPAECDCAIHQLFTEGVLVSAVTKPDGEKWETIYRFRPVQSFFEI